MADASITAIVGAVTGSLGFGLACISLWRSVLSEGRTQRMLLAQRRQEAFATITAAEVAVLTARRKLLSLNAQLIDKGGGGSLSEVKKDSDEFLKVTKDAPETLRRLRTSLEKIDVTKESKELLFHSIEAIAAAVRKAADPEVMEANVDMLVAKTEMHLRFLEKAAEVKAKLGGR